LHQYETVSFVDIIVKNEINFVIMFQSNPNNDNNIVYMYSIDYMSVFVLIGYFTSESTLEIMCMYVRLNVGCVCACVRECACSRMHCVWVSVRSLFA